MIDYIKKTEEIRAFTEAHVKKSRYEHSVRVAEMCARMCRQYRLDARKGYLAGIGHDMCKDFSDEDLIELASHDGNPIIDFENSRFSYVEEDLSSMIILSEEIPFSQR